MRLAFLHSDAGLLSPFLAPCHSPLATIFLFPFSIFAFLFLASPLREALGRGYHR
jgi:hypothetical protein